MLRIRLTIEGDIVIDRVLSGIDERARDMTPAWPALVRVFREIIRRAFESEGTSTGQPWPQLAERTVEDRQRHGYGPRHPILQRTTTLMRSLVIGDSGGFVRSTATSIDIGTTVDYFKYHQSNRPRSKLPRRAPVLLTADDRNALMRPIRLHLTGMDPDAPQRSAIA